MQHSQGCYCAFRLRIVLWFGAGFVIYSDIVNACLLPEIFRG